MELSDVVARAGSAGIQLLEDFLRWDPERRPTAQQSLKYPYFQIVKRISSTTHHMSQMPHQNQSTNNGMNGHANGYVSMENGVDVNDTFGDEEQFS